MIYLCPILIVGFLFSICILSNSINKLKQEIKLIWKCVDENRRRLADLEEQSNQAYRTLMGKTMDTQKLMDNKTKDSRNQSAPDH